MSEHARRPSIPFRVLAEGRQRVMPRRLVRDQRDDRTPWRIEPADAGRVAVFDQRGNPIGTVGIDVAQRVVAAVNAAAEGART